MQKLLAILFLSLNLALPARSAGAEGKAAPTPAESLLSQWVDAQKGAADLRISFKLTRTLPTLKEPTVIEGRFWKFADGRFRWEAGSPPSLVLVYDKSTIWSWDSTDAKWQKLSPSDGRMRMWMPFLSGKDLTAESLEKNFTATISARTKDSVTVLLLPKSSGVRRHVKQMDLQIDPDNKHLLQFHILQADQSEVSMSFAEPRRMTEAEKNVIMAPGEARSSS